MAIPKKVVDYGVKNAEEIARKGYEAGFGKGFVSGAKWVGKEIGPIGGKMVKAKLDNGVPNKELRSVGSKILHICKKIKRL
jgi:hypothetical protein